MISKKYYRNDTKNECGICFETYNKTIKCDKCKFNVCGECWIQLLEMGTCLITKKVNYEDPLFGFHIKCPQCRTVEKQHITNDYIKKIKMSYPQFINKITKFNSPVEDFYMEMETSESDEEPAHDSSDDEDNTNNNDNTNDSSATGQDQELDNSIVRFRRNTNEDVARLIRINNMFREDNRRLKNEILQLRTMLPN